MEQVSFSRKILVSRWLTKPFPVGVHVYRIERSPKVGKLLSPWAIKRIRASNKCDQKDMITSRLLEEANILKQLDHPNIVGYRGSKVLADKRVILAMENCDTSLGDVLQSRHDEASGPLESLKIKKMALDICRGLDYLHTKAFILHGDIKSFNILIKGDYELCKLCDFGVSLPLNEEGYLDLVKKPQAEYTGTDLWSAPEVFNECAEDVSSKCDIFSFGLVIYECIALQPPHSDQLNNDGDDGEIIDADASVSSDQQKSLKAAKLSFNETMESDCSENKENETSLNSMEESLDDSTVDGNGLEQYLGTRPAIPDAYELPQDYNIVMEIFFICTNELPENRPNAGYIANHLAGVLEKWCCQMCRNPKRITFLYYEWHLRCFLYLIYKNGSVYD